MDFTGACIHPVAMPDCVSSLRVGSPTVREGIVFQALTLPPRSQMLRRGPRGVRASDTATDTKAFYLQLIRDGVANSRAKIEREFAKEPAKSVLEFRAGKRQV